MSRPSRTAVFYHYFEANEHYRENLIFFLSVAYAQDADFFIVISADCSVDLPKRDNISVIYAENKNLDYGGYVQGLATLESTEDYDTYIFINSSVRGPFLPTAFKGQWLDMFRNELHGDVHLVGSTINIYRGPTSPKSPGIWPYRPKSFDYPEPYSHVQTSAYALTRKALNHLMDIGFYEMTASMPKEELIWRYEIRLSQEINRQGWNMKSFLPEYNQQNYSQPHQDNTPVAFSGDPSQRNGYFGRTAHPREVVFIKSNWSLISNGELASHTYSELSTRSTMLTDNWNESEQLKLRSLEKMMQYAEEAHQTARRKGHLKTLLQPVRCLFWKIKQWLRA